MFAKMKRSLKEIEHNDKRREAQEIQRLQSLTEIHLIMLAVARICDQGVKWGDWQAKCLAQELRRRAGPSLH